MCFLMTVTFMHYCVKKVYTGSCSMEICCLSCLVLLPMLAFLFTLYFLLPYFVSDEEDGSSNRRLKPNCEKSRIIGVLERIYPDANQFKFKCTGLNFGDNLGVTLTECFDRGDPIPNLHYLSSRSSNWNKGNTLHKIIHYNTATEQDKSITIMKVKPALPEPCSVDDDDDNLEGDDNYFYIEQKYYPDTDHTLVGWSYTSRLANAPFQELPIYANCIAGYPSAAVFSMNGRYFSGFQSGKCTEEDTFEDSLVPYNIFLEKIHELYPNVEFKSNVPLSQRYTEIQKFFLKAQIGPNVDQTTNLLSNSMKSIDEVDTFRSVRVNDINIGMSLNWKNDNKGKITKGIMPTVQFAIPPMRSVEFEPPLPVGNMTYCASQLSRTALCSECMPVFKCCQRFNTLGCRLTILRLCRSCGSQPGVEQCCKQFGIWLKRVQLVPEIATEYWRFQPFITDFNRQNGDE